MQETLSACQNVTGAPQDRPRTQVVELVLGRFSTDTSQPSAGTGVVASPPPLQTAGERQHDFQPSGPGAGAATVSWAEAESWPVVSNEVACIHHDNWAGGGGASRALDQEIESSCRIDLEHSNS